MSRLGPPVNEEMRAILREAMADKKITIAELARRVPMTPSVLYNFFSGRNQSSRDLPRIAQALGIPLARLLPMTNVEKRWTDLYDRLRASGPDPKQWMKMMDVIEKVIDTMVRAHWWDIHQKSQRGED